MFSFGERVLMLLRAVGCWLIGAPGALYRAIKKMLLSAGRAIRSFCRQVATGDFWVKSSLLVCGMGYFGRGQYLKGALVTLLEAAALFCFPTFLWPYLSKFDTLGDVERKTVFNMETMKNEVNDYDDSFMIMLFSVVAILFIIAFILLYIKNIRVVRDLQDRAEKGKPINTFVQDCAALMNKKFHITLLSVPIICVLVFSITPLIVMILTGFTSYDQYHLSPAKLFTWVGLDNYKTLFENSLSVTFGYSFQKVMGWTLIWAFFATFTNYYAGILLAMFINNKRTRCKKVWRTGFVVSIAVPQFVSLLLVRSFFANTGIVNTLCNQWGITQLCRDWGLISSTASYIPFLTNASWAKVMIILINMWVGVPYIMLMSTGIIMNIPGDLLESAQIDGANAWQRFRKITMPYIRFVTGPYLISSIVGNINNFNIIYLLTDEMYVTQDQMLANSNAREVDLLVTWLYRLTQNFKNYKMASVLGMMVFVICAVITVIAFSRLTKGNREENFQ